MCRRRIYTFPRRWICRRRGSIWTIFCLIICLVTLYSLRMIRFVRRTQQIPEDFWTRELLSEAYVLPNQNTVIYNPSFSQCSKANGSNIYTLFMVISSPTSRRERDVIRSGMKFFLSELDNFGLDSETGELITNELLFFTGISKVPTEHVELLNEAKIYNDIVVDEFSESYFNLTLKSLRMLKWVQLNCDEAEFTVKIDDDVHLNLPLFYKFLKNQQRAFNRRELIGGMLRRDDKPDRDVESKWYSPVSIWPEETFPSFVAGFLYVLGVDSRNRIYTESLNQKIFHLEDVFITGIVATRILGLELTDIGGIVAFWSPFYNFYTTSCDIQEKYTVVHFLFNSFNYLECWKEFNDKDFVCDNWPLGLTC